MNYERLGITRVINASGRMTALGGVALSPEVQDAMVAGGRYNVPMDLLKSRAGEMIAEFAGAQAAMVTTGAAAGICIMGAAVVAGSDPGRVRALPDADWAKREILLQAGHASHFGAPVTQMLRVGGARPIVIGDVNMVSEPLLRSAIGSHTAGFLFVQSHHCVQKGMLSLERCLAICHEQGVPVLVDAAAEEDIKLYIEMGVDLVTYSGGKAFEGPTSGFIAGRADLVAACQAQEIGIARGMKVGKETILGLLAALERYCNTDRKAETERQLALIEGLEAGLAGLPHTQLHRMADEAGRGIVRLGLTLAEQRLGFTATELIKALQQGAPAVVLRGHWANTGTVAIDSRPIEATDVPIIVAKIRQAYADRGPTAPAGNGSV
jgi:D-glucosaminate-6-phosphate ammonia-lyase